MIVIGEDPDDNGFKCHKLLKRIIELWEMYIKSIDNNIPKDILESSINYLALKTIKICVNYPIYRQWLFDESFFSPNAFSDTIEILLKDESYICSRIRNTITFLKKSLYFDEVGEIDIQEWTKEKLNASEIKIILPPSFYYFELLYAPTKNKNGEETRISLNSFSSGEKQLLFSLSSLFEHLMNLSSIPVTDSNRIPYHHVNVIIDEIELYFHPEYQRCFISMLLDALSSGIIDRRKIRSINILMATHSPYILSDIPECNILFLGKKHNKDRKYRTLAANIYDLLHDGFFMDSSIGEFSAKHMQRILEIANMTNEQERTDNFIKDRECLYFLIDEIGDPYLRKIMTDEVRQLEYISIPEKDIDQKIETLKRELFLLNKLKK